MFQPKWWHSIVWKVKVALKGKCFFWLVLKHKILTWDALQRRGFHGPSKCIFCLNALESVEHLFVVCTCFHSPWLRICCDLRCHWTWSDGSSAYFLSKVVDHPTLSLELVMVFYGNSGVQKPLYFSNDSG